MLEALFLEQEAPGIRKKKRKVEDAPMDLDQDDDDYYGAAPRGGKKAKGGVGYAGQGKEDVCVLVWFVSGS